MSIKPVQAIFTLNRDRFGRPNENHFVAKTVRKPRADTSPEITYADVHLDAVNKQRIIHEVV